MTAIHQKIEGLYTLCDLTMNPKLSYLSLAERLLKGGAPILQLRMKGERDLQKVFEVAKEIKLMKRHFDFTFIVNDHVEVAQAASADGIHIGQDDLPISKVRKIIGPNKIIGYSSHSLSEAIQAEKSGADYVALGAIFPTQTKGKDHPVLGLPILRQACSTLKVPMVAIGGINRHNFFSILQTGVAAIAMISALTLAQNISNETNEFVEQFNAFHSQRAKNKI